MQGQKFQTYSFGQPNVWPHYDLPIDRTQLPAIKAGTQVAYFKNWTGFIQFHNYHAEGDNPTWQQIQGLYEFVRPDVELLDTVADSNPVSMLGDVDYATPPNVAPGFTLNYLTGPPQASTRWAWDPWTRVILDGPGNVTEFSCAAHALRNPELGHGGIAGWYLYQGTIGANIRPPGTP